MDCSKTAIVCASISGIRVADIINNHMHANVYVPCRLKYPGDFHCYDDIKKEIKSIFNNYDCIIMVMALGAAIRIIAPFLRSKFNDPRIISVDDNGKFSISMISGHRGANDLALYVSGLLGGEAVITTASEISGVMSPEVIAYKYGMKIMNKSRIKYVTSEIINNGGFRLINRTGIHINISGSGGKNYGIIITYIKEKSTNFVVMVPKVLVIGIGFSTYANFNSLKDHIKFVFKQKGFYISSVYAIATIDIKSDNDDIKKIAKWLNARIFFFDNNTLNKYSSYRSETVYKYTGAYSVANAAARAASNNGNEIIRAEKFKDAVISVFEYENK
ncbi:MULTISPECIES: cobalt-precorrin 5A hydrolase [Acidiplasma]|uniref:Cobalamin biosynthesis protein CbiG n=1 Tax=Acidiplasma aeolicum TaxID=507754 RepID=A0A0Q0VN50_9ARCH|nr:MULTISPECIES: cobalamin biosynthesis protein [Acidiplasma]KJE49894.1 hypothetical protein TZ01_02105 [Acidiplasma sp. MBA-1]KPV44026.1 hypothetical protein SE19_08890 [Acidiplasma aeolicum]KQB34848.1 hypothetical protein AOG54_03555 [Acidiplasma aeolicum]WMT55073.1 MAG: cobalamin biosynthesis protein [Acidiplasma sp.]